MVTLVLQYLGAEIGSEEQRWLFIMNKSKYFLHVDLLNMELGAGETSNYSPWKLALEKFN